MIQHVDNRMVVAHCDRFLKAAQLHTIHCQRHIQIREKIIWQMNQCEIQKIPCLLLLHQLIQILLVDMNVQRSFSKNIQFNFLGIRHLTINTQLIII